MRKLYLTVLPALVLAACSTGKAPKLDSDLNVQACSPIISIDEGMQLLRDTKDSWGRSIPGNQWVTAGAIAKAESNLCIRAFNENSNNTLLTMDYFRLIASISTALYA